MLTISDWLGLVMTRNLTICWAAAVGWSFLSLALFRSHERHGPDMVGAEIAGFVLPLLVALILSVALMIGERKRGGILILNTLVLLFFEVICYFAFVIR